MIPKPRDCGGTECGRNEVGVWVCVAPCESLRLTTAIGDDLEESEGWPVEYRMARAPGWDRLRSNRRVA